MKRLLLLLSACAPLAPPVPGPPVYCRDVPENAAALAEAEKHPGADVLIVPGYSASTDEDPTEVNAIGKERLLRAVLAWRRGVSPFILLTGGYGEAEAMKRWLVAGGIPESAILLEPCALHSTTNLRNAGRILLSAGLGRGIVVTSYDQAIYFGRPLMSMFYWRCIKQLGYMVGAVRHIDAQTVAFSPSPQVFLRGTDRADP